MIYSHNNKYYVNISPRIYCEVEITSKDNKLVITPTHNKIELSGNANISKVDLKSLENELKTDSEYQENKSENKGKRSSKKYY